MTRDRLATAMLTGELTGRVWVTAFGCDDMASVTNRAALVIRKAAPNQKIGAE
jgi:hypothetical protein